MSHPATDAFRDAQEQMLRRYGVEARSRFLDDPAAMWAPLMAHLGGFHLLAVDRPGIGLTGAAELRLILFHDDGRGWN